MKPSSDPQHKRLRSMMSVKLFLALFATCLFFSESFAAARLRMDLDGTWTFRLDPDNVGEQKEWFRKTIDFDKEIVVPGVWQAQGIGQPNGFLKNHYVGRGWYQKIVAVPGSWKDKIVWLKIGGASRYTKAYVNGRFVGSHDGFSTPFKFDVTRHLRPGGENVLTIMVDNDWPKVPAKVPGPRDFSKPIGFLVYQANWGGIYSHVELEAHNDPYIKDVLITPDVDRQLVRLKLELEKRFGPGETAYRIAARVTSHISPAQYDKREPLDLLPGASLTLTMEVPIPKARLWSPNDPFLYDLTLDLTRDGQTIDRIENRFGMRKLSVNGERLLLNNQPVFLYGYGDLDVEPRTGVPPFTKEEQIKRLRLAKAYGFNHARLHSRMPPVEYLEAADEEGLLISFEIPVVYSQFLLPHVDFLREELKRMMLTVRNHPSAFSLAMGNELDPVRHFKQEERPLLQKVATEFYRAAKELNPNIFVLASDGFNLPPGDIAMPMRGYVPGMANIAHEFGGYPCSLPNPALISKFNGLMVPYWLQQTDAWVKENGLTAIYQELVHNSERLQFESRKYKIERLRSTNKFNGYHLWAITDAPSGIEGGPWEEGVLDYFWDPKSVAAEQYRQLQSDVLLLIDAEPSQRTFWLDRGKVIGVSLSNVGPGSYKNGTLRWKLVDDSSNRILDSGTTTGIDVTPATVKKVSKISIGKLGGDQPLRCHLELTFFSGELQSENSWKLWGYPRNLFSTSSVNVVSKLRTDAPTRLYNFINTDVANDKKVDLAILPFLDPESLALVKQGGKAIIYLDEGRFDQPRQINYFPDFVFWFPKAWATKIESHPLTTKLVHDGYLDQQFFNFIENGYGLSEHWMFGAENSDLRPIIWGVRTVPGGLEKLGFLYEFRVGEGKVILSSFNIEKNLNEEQPAIVYFFDRVLRYAISDDFRPRDEVTEEQFSGLLFTAYR